MSQTAIQVAVLLSKGQNCGPFDSIEYAVGPLQCDQIWRFFGLRATY